MERCRECLSGGWLGRGLIVLIAVTLWGCTENVYHGLSEQAANDMVVVLEQHAIEGQKVRDPAGDDLWAVAVPSKLKVEAWRILQVEGLPRPETSGFGAFYPSGGLIPTNSEERILLQYATAQELRQTLLKIEGVVDAHVNLVLPEKPRIQLTGSVASPPRASVLVKYRPFENGVMPVEPDGVKALVAGGVEGLEADDVTVVMTRLIQSQKPLQEPSMQQIGPVAVASNSKTALQVIILVMGGIIVVLASVVVFLLLRRRTA